MVIIISLIYTVFTALYFGLFRLIDYKKKELLQFLLIFTALLALMACLSFIFTKEYPCEYWHPHFDPIREQLIMALFYVPPTFGIAYLLYPFKIINRNQTLLWVLLCYTLMFVGVALFLVSLNNM